MYPQHADRWLAQTLKLCAFTAAGVLLLVVSFVIYESWPAISNGNWLLFLNSSDWFPSDNEYQLWPMLLASILVSTGALLAALFFGIASALFMQFTAPIWLVGYYRSLITLLAGIPSVVYGLWGLTVLVPLINLLEPPGTSLLAGIIILALMVLPTVALTADAALANVPRSLIQGAACLGMRQSTIMLFIAVPAARGGIITGAILALARALGETMAVLMVAGNVVQVPSSWFDPVRVLTANMALEMAYAVDHHRSALFVSGLVLLVLVSLLTWLAHNQERRHAN
ncbi:MAG: phosphate ABC transporter permease subunit PstC [Moraxellaceae bacterium]|nr:phosphate ABC transporter permease subunit PstC [Moraxellaceae bacterium]MDZ4385726.1 phosphate ABC transporter permease subunit PstC [Moraxellaceae bacterium]